MNNKERIIRNEFEKDPQFIEALIFANEVRCMMDYILQGTGTDILKKNVQLLFRNCLDQLSSFPIEWSTLTSIDDIVKKHVEKLFRQSLEESSASGIPHIVEYYARPNPPGSSFLRPELFID